MTLLFDGVSKFLNSYVIHVILIAVLKQTKKLFGDNLMTSSIFSPLNMYMLKNTNIERNTVLSSSYFI